MIAYCPSFSSKFVVAMTAANARISALEAELNAARGAWEVSNAGMVSAEKIASQQKPRLKRLKKPSPMLIRDKSSGSSLYLLVLTRSLLLLVVSVMLFFFGYLLRLVFADICLLSFNCFSVMQQRKLEYLGNFSTRY
jgi:hypothetical protein